LATVEDQLNRFCPSLKRASALSHSSFGDCAWDGTENIRIAREIVSVQQKINRAEKDKLFMKQLHQDWK
jgi:hypothetical protein